MNEKVMNSSDVNLQGSFFSIPFTKSIVLLLVALITIMVIFLSVDTNDILSSIIDIGMGAGICFSLISVMRIIYEMDHLRVTGLYRFLFIGKKNFDFNHSILNSYDSKSH